MSNVADRCAAPVNDGEYIVGDYNVIRSVSSRRAACWHGRKPETINSGEGSEVMQRHWTTHVKRKSRIYNMCGARCGRVLQVVNRRIVSRPERRSSCRIKQTLQRGGARLPAVAAYRVNTTWMTTTTTPGWLTSLQSPEVVPDRQSLAPRAPNGG